MCNQSFLTKFPALDLKNSMFGKDNSVLRTIYKRILLLRNVEL
jgi:hypothetical protein